MFSVHLLSVHVIALSTCTVNYCAIQESPSVSHKSVVGGSALWRDLSLQQTSLPNKIPKTPPSHGTNIAVTVGH